MQRRNFLKATGILAAMGSFPLLTANSAHGMKNINFRHVVYFWLKEPENEMHHALFLKNLQEFLGSMDNILDAFVGKPANTPREVVDNSYQYSINLGFENRAEQDKYQAHPVHKIFIEKTSHLWERVQVYDSVPV